MDFTFHLFVLGEGDAEQSADLARDLRQDLLYLAVDDVRIDQPRLGAAGGGQEWRSELVVVLAWPMTSLRVVLSAIRAWLLRGRGKGRTVQLSHGGNRLSQGSVAEQERLLSELYARQMGAEMPAPYGAPRDTNPIKSAPPERPRPRGPLKVEEPAYPGPRTEVFRPDSSLSNSNKPLIVLNTRQAGRLGQQVNSLGGFAQASLERGTGAFVSTIRSVGDEPSSTFVTTFCHELLRRQPVPAAASRAWREACGTGDGTWPAYAAYARSQTHLLTSGPAALAGGA